MGKSNRIRVNRVDTKLSAPKKKQKGMPSWAVSLLTIVITVAIVCSAVLLIMSSNGIFGRMKIAMQSEDYKINQNTFSYFFKSNYANFQNENKDYLSYYSLDTTKSLKDQEYGKSSTGMAYETYYLGEFDGTWYDYFMNQTKEQVKTTLIYCEAADALGIELEEGDFESIDASIQSIETTAAMYGTTLNAYLAMNYGAGVNVKDVRKGLELSALATKCSNVIAEQISDAVTDEMIKAEYDSNKVDYDLIDYMMYTVSVKYDDAVKAVLGSDYSENYELTAAQEDEVKEKYIELIADAEVTANKFAESETVEEFYTAVSEYVLSKEYDTAYDKVNFSDEEDPIPEPSEEDKATIKEKIIADVIIEVQKNRNDSSATASKKAVKDDDGVWTIYGIEIDTAYATEINTIYTNLYANFVKTDDSLTKEGVNFSDTNKFILGAFKDLVVADGESAEDIEKIEVGDTKVLFAGDEDLEEQADDYVMYEYFNANAYILTKAPYQNLDHAKDLSYILSTDKTVIENIIKALKELDAVDADAFAKIVEDEAFVSKAYHYTYEDYVEGTFGVAAFDNWIFKDGLKEGTFSDTVITMDESTENGTTSGTYCVGFFNKNGHEKWYVAAKNSVLNDSYEAKNTELTNAHTVEINEKVIAGIDA